MFEEVLPSSIEGKYVLFRIQLISADPSVQIVRIIKSHSQFDDLYLNHMKIDCAIDATNFPQSSIQQLKNRNPQRFTFEAGYIKPKAESHSSSSSSSSKKPSSASLQANPKLKKFFLFKLAISQCLPIDKSGNSIFEKVEQFPTGIDTIYISESKQQLNIYPHRYRVKDRSQCLLEYEVDFITKGLQGMNKWNPNQIMCQNCQTNKAIHYCPQDRQAYCRQCFDKLHQSIRKKTHQTQPLNPFNSTSFCPFHSRQKLTHYSFDKKELKCQICIKSQKKQSEIIKLLDLQKQLSIKQSKFLYEIKQKTKQLIIKIQQKLKIFQKNYLTQRQQLQDLFKSKLIKIKQQHQKNIKVIIHYHTQLKRKYDQLLWVQNFIHYSSNFLIAQDNIQMKDSFFRYLDNMAIGEYQQRVSKNIQQFK